MFRKLALLSLFLAAFITLIGCTIVKGTGEKTEISTTAPTISVRTELGKVTKVRVDRVGNITTAPTIGTNSPQGEVTKVERIEIKDTPPAPIIQRVTIAAAGDVTLGGDQRINQITNFLSEIEAGDYAYYLSNVREIFETSDIAIVNLEGALTNNRSHANKQFVFRADPELVEVLTAGGVTVVTIANNHARDYGQIGYADTVATLETAGVSYFGNDYITTIDVNGIVVGMFGYSIWGDSQEYRNNITQAIQQLREQGADVVIAYYHWGIERDNYPTAYQKAIGRYTIDAGADLVLGSHPHVLQGIETYQGKQIVYSFGNFCFGGNRNPADKDSMIFTQEFVFTDGELTDMEVKIIPCRISSITTRNDFRPTPLDSEDADRVMKRLTTYSSKFDTSLFYE